MISRPPWPFDAWRAWIREVRSGNLKLEAHQSPIRPLAVPPQRNVVVDRLTDGQRHEYSSGDLGTPEPTYQLVIAWHVEWNANGDQAILRHGEVLRDASGCAFSLNATPLPSVR